MDSIFVNSPLVDAKRRLMANSNVDHSLDRTLWCLSVRHLIQHLAQPLLALFAIRKQCPISFRCLPILLSSLLSTVAFKLVQCALTQNTDFCFALNIKFIKTFLFILSRLCLVLARFQMVVAVQFGSNVGWELALCIADFSSNLHRRTFSP